MTALICICADMREYVRGASIGGSNKRSEILSNSADVIDLVGMLVADQEGIGKGRPADLTGMSGRWAGRSIAWIEDGTTEDPENRWSEATGLDAIFDEALEKWTDVGPAMVDVMLGIHGRALLKQEYRTRHLDGTTSLYVHRMPMPVMRRGDAIVADTSWVGDHENYLRIYEESKDLLETLPADTIFDGDGMGKGERRLIVNLTRREYIDPEALGEVPTLAGLVRATSKNLGGHLTDESDHQRMPVALQMAASLMMDPTEWWNDRIVLTGAGHGPVPSSDDIMKDPGYRNRTHGILTGLPVPDMTIIAKRLAQRETSR